jgi:enhancing lycopene biosynthesis protein 2
MAQKTVAVVLSGCGYLDGAEIREAVGVLWALSRHDVAVECFAPDANQVSVVNHLTGKEASETRNILHEAARIARGKIRPLSELPTLDYDALVMPGGFGAAKNLCTFAAEGAAGKVLYEELINDITGMHEESRPIGAICIAPAVVGLALKGMAIEMTVGEAGGASAEIEKMGHKHIVCGPDQIHIDERNNIITTPAYMYDDAPLHKIFAGIGALVDAVVARIK